jgi:hypothetical protein
LIKDVVQEVQKSEFAEEITAALDERRGAMEEEARAKWEIEQKKKKAKGNEEFDPSKLVPRLPDELLTKAYIWRL